MRVLFDNGTPRQLRHRLFGHDVEISRELGWHSLANGALLARAEEAGFDVLITTDHGFRYQQNMANRRISVVILMITSWPQISRNTEPIRSALEEIQPGELREVPIPGRREG